MDKKLINEAPTGEGPEFTKEVKPEAVPSANYKDFYLGKKFPGQEDRLNKIANIIVKVKEFLLSQPNKVYSGDYKSFRDEVSAIVLKELPNIGSADAGYCARKIQDYLLDSKTLVDERDGFKVEKPIKTIEVARKIEPRLAPVFKQLNKDNGEDEPEEVEQQVQAYTPTKSKEQVKPSFDTGVKYEKYGDRYKEGSLTEEEQDALDIVSENDTGSKIIEKLHAARRFRSKPIEQIYSIISGLIKKSALSPAGGYQFTVQGDDLPAARHHEREKKSNSIGENFMRKDDSIAIFEAYKVSKKEDVVNEGILSRTGNKVLSKLSTIAPNTAAAAKGRLQGEKSSNALYKAFLQQASMAGYTKWGKVNVPGNFLVNWLTQNVSPSIQNLPDAQSVIGLRAVANPQQIFNKLLQASYGVSVTQPPEEPNPYVTIPSQETSNEPAEPKAQEGEQTPPAIPAPGTITTFDLEDLLAKLARSNNRPARESAIRSALKKANVKITQ